METAGKGGKVHVYLPVTIISFVFIQGFHIAVHYVESVPSTLFLLYVPRNSYAWAYIVPHIF